MTDLTPPSGRVHWIGTGMSSGSGVALVCDGAQALVWGRTVERAQRLLESVGRPDGAALRAFTGDALDEELRKGDVVVSMLPPSEHHRLLGLAIGKGAHFVCSSYANPAILDRAEEATARGLVVLTEIGLDPGIDHLLGHKLVAAARSVVGDRPATARFTSYCGSNPAEPNDFRYRFSWAPRGVLTALLTPARHIEDGEPTDVRRPWEWARPRRLGGEIFEAYPNRDSVPYVDAYEIPSTWRLATFVRGTLRLQGWQMAWAAVFEELSGADDDRITELAADLARGYPATADDFDRVVMAVRLEVTPDDGPSYAGEGVLDVTGTAQELATPRLVSVPLALGALDVVAGQVPPGAHRASSDPATVDRWLDRLAAEGIPVTFTC